MKNFLIFLFVILTLAGAGGSYYFYNKYSDANKLLADPNALVQKEESKVIDMLGKLIDLPTDEKPTVATVLDKEKLKDQPFFAKAENGDKLIVFAQSKKAILYRESTNKIVEFAQLVLEAEPTPTKTVTKKTVEAEPTPTEVVTPTPQ